jgi:hypothetical protein
MPFSTWLPSVAPPWLARAVGAAYFRVVGGVMDSVRQRLVEAAKVRMPSFAAAMGASDALEAIGRDRLLPRGAAESDIPYALRLVGAWDTWGGDNTPLTGKGGGAGAHLGLLNALALLGLPTGPTGATIVQQNGRYAQLDGDGLLVLGDLMTCINRQDLTGAVNARPGWTFEGRDNFYSEFGMVFPADVPALTAGSVLAAQLEAAAARWKPGKAVYVGAWVIEAGRTLGWPTGRTLGTDPNLGGNTIRYLPPAGGNRIGYTP